MFVPIGNVSQDKQLTVKRHGIKSLRDHDLICVYKCIDNSC